MNTAFQAWQRAGSPVIPRKWYRTAQYTASPIEGARIKAAIDQYSKVQSAAAERGFLGRASQAVGKFFQRRGA